MDEKDFLLWYILGPILGFIFLLLVAFFLIKYIRLKKANVNLREDLKSFAFSNEIQKMFFIKKKKFQKKIRIMILLLYKDSNSLIIEYYIKKLI